MFSQATRKNPFYIDTKSRYASSTPAETPVIFTTSMSFCVVIAFVYKEDAAVKRFALYHSYSEHIDCDDDYIKKALAQPISCLYNQLLHGKPDNLILAIKEFLSHVVNMSDVRITVAVNKEYSELMTNTDNPENAISYSYTKRLVNHVCKILGREPVTHFDYFRGGYDFFLFNDGGYVSTQLHTTGSDNLKMADRIADFIQENMRAMGSNADKTILANIEKMPSENKIQQCKNLCIEIHKARGALPFLSTWSLSKTPKRDLRFLRYLDILAAVCNPSEKPVLSTRARNEM